MRQYCNDINYDFIENLLNVFSTTLFHIPRTYATTWKPPFKTSTFITTKLFIIKKATQEYSFFPLSSICESASCSASRFALSLVGRVSPSGSLCQAGNSLSARFTHDRVWDGGPFVSHRCSESVVRRSSKRGYAGESKVKSRANDGFADRAPPGYVISEQLRASQVGYGVQRESSASAGRSDEEQRVWVRDYVVGGRYGAGTRARNAENE